MLFHKTGLVFTALLLSTTVPTFGQAYTITSSEATTGGLRVQFNSEGDMVQPVPEQLQKTSFREAPASQAGARSVMSAPIPSSQAVGASAGATASSDAGSGKVVRLNGLFHAASRARIGADGKIEGDCHIDGNGKKDKGRHK